MFLGGWRRVYLGFVYFLIFFRLVWDVLFSPKFDFFKACFVVYFELGLLMIQACSGLFMFGVLLLTGMFQVCLGLG